MNLNKLIRRWSSELNLPRKEEEVLLNDDQIRPNFVHSSDIPRKVAGLIHSISKSKSKRISEECGNGCCDINVNIELNALACRRSTKLIALLQRDMISVAQMDGDSNTTERQSYIYGIITNQKQKKLQPDVLRTKDVFVVTMKLVVSNFDALGHFILEEDEDFHLLQSYDPKGELIDEIRRYIKETCVITQKQHQIKAKNEGSHSDLSDSTLECSEDDVLYTKEDFGGAKIEPLVSNETLTGEFRRRFSDISNEEKGVKFKHSFLDDIDNLRHNDEDEDVITGAEKEVTAGEEKEATTDKEKAVFIDKENEETAGEENDVSTDKERDVTTDEEKDTTTDEERDMTSDEDKDVTPEKSLSRNSTQVLFQNEPLKQPVKYSPLTPEHPIHLDDLIEVPYEESDHELTDDFEVHRLVSSSPKKRYEDDDKIMKISRNSSFQSPTKRRSRPHLSSSHSVSLINTDDKLGLKYAYNSDSAVPSYIKQNKKFKFIKVGKVQKFVHLFEEQTQSERK
ncbi:CTA9 [Candida metapsilosis]|uniref:CTA9 n=1 Tax=Candida metapsilosis TaxID=273372 RepID=A0A8H7ZB99_9ASCO|nr:CTA9 [Candida metapsilosis]